MVSPFRAFKEIVENPDIKGVILIAGFIALTSAAQYYSYSSKVFLYVNGYPTSILNSSSFSYFIMLALIQDVLVFVESWLIYAGILFIITRFLGNRTGSWRLFFVLVGYAFSIMIIKSVVSIVLITALPEIQLTNLSTWPPSTQDEIVIANDAIKNKWGPISTYQLLSYLNFPYANIFDFWLVIVSFALLRTFNEITFKRAIIISFTAFTIRILLKMVLGF